MVLRMTGAREPSLAMSDTEHVGHVYLLGQQRTQEVAGDRVSFVDLCSLFPLIDCQSGSPRRRKMVRVGYVASVLKKRSMLRTS